jgi:hypothetical protein
MSFPSQKRQITNPRLLHAWTIQLHDTDPLRSHFSSQPLLLSLANGSVGLCPLPPLHSLLGPHSSLAIRIATLVLKNLHPVMNETHDWNFREAKRGTDVEDI